MYPTRVLLLSIFPTFVSLLAFAAPPNENGALKLVQPLNSTSVLGYSEYDAFAGLHCPTGTGPCSDGGCCPVGGQCCILYSCCPAGYYCVRNAASTRVGCCPNGETCYSPASTEVGPAAEGATIGDVA